MQRLGHTCRCRSNAKKVFAPGLLRLFSWLLVAAVAVHAAFSPAANWSVAASCQTEEESDPRQAPAEEEVNQAIGPAPPRGLGVGRAKVLYVLLRKAVKQCPAAAKPRNLQSPELASRNGVGAPLRC